MHEEPDNFPASELTPGEAEPEANAADEHQGLELEQAALELDGLEEIQLPPVKSKETEPEESGPLEVEAGPETSAAEEHADLELEQATLELDGLEEIRLPPVEPEKSEPEEPGPEEAEPGESGAEEEEPEEAELELESAPPMEQYCIFRSGRERFCLHVLEVDEVVDWPRLTSLPLAPPFLMGIFNLRGTIVPVVDIAFTEVRRADLSPKQVVVACLRDAADGTEVRVGIAADEVIGTYSTCEELLLEEAPRDVPHCAGMLRHGHRLALALDLQRVLEAFPVGSI